MIRLICVIDAIDFNQTNIPIIFRKMLKLEDK